MAELTMQFHVGFPSKHTMEPAKTLFNEKLHFSYINHYTLQKCTTFPEKKIFEVYLQRYLVNNFNLKKLIHSTIVYTSVSF